MHYLVANLPLELDCLVSCKETHILTTIFFIAIAIFGGKKKIKHAKRRGRVCICISKLLLTNI
jgi:hypothetical protein